MDAFCMVWHCTLHQHRPAVSACPVCDATLAWRMGGWYCPGCAHPVLAARQRAEPCPVCDGVPIPVVATPVSWLVEPMTWTEVEA